MPLDQPNPALAIPHGLNSLHEDVDLSAAEQDDNKSLPTKASDSIGSKAERDSATASGSSSRPS